MNKYNAVTPIRLDLHLTDEQKYDNWLATQPAEMFEHAEGIYARRTDVSLHGGWLLVPCEMCGNPVRTTIQVTDKGETPVAHRDFSGAEYDGDIVTCLPCIEDTRWITTEKLVA